MKKELKDLTIQEFNEYNDMLSMDEPDIFGIFELFGMDAKDMPMDKFQKNWTKIQQMVLTPTVGVHKTYTIKGRRFKIKLNYLKLSAGQFIDFQSYMRDFKLEEILSVFMIPQYRKWGKWRTHKYNDGYDIIEVQDFLLKNMTIGTAQSITDFFFKSSLKSLEVMKAFSEKKEWQMRAKRLKMLQQEDNLHG